MDWIYINYAFIQIYVRFHSQLRFLFQEQCLGNEHDCTRNSLYFLMKREIICLEIFLIFPFNFQLRSLLIFI